MVFFKPDIEKLRKKNKIKSLIKALSYKEALVRCGAAYAIGQIFGGNHESPSKDTAALALAKTLQDADFNVRDAAVHALGHMRRVDPLIEVLEKGEKPLRITAAKAMGWNPNNINVAAALAVALKKDSDEEVRRYAAISIGSIIENRKRQFDQYHEDSDRKIVDECSKALIESLGDTPLVCSGILLALAKSKEASAVPYLINGLGSENEAVRKKAVVGLGIAGPSIGKEGVGALVRTVLNNDESRAIRESAILSLGDVQTDIAIQALFMLQKTPAVHEFKVILEYAIRMYPAHVAPETEDHQETKGLYWAYLHKKGEIKVKEWYRGNSYLHEANESSSVEHFLEEPFEAESFEEAEKIAAQLLLKLVETIELGGDQSP